MANPTKNYETTGGTVDSGGARPFNWSSMFPTVTCPDGTKDIANGIAPPCMGKYGNPKPIVNKNPVESQQMLALEKAKLEEEKAMFDAQKKQQNNTKEPIFYILVTAGVLVAGYFAYKKFKK
jgi:hypothetical protein